METRVERRRSNEPKKFRVTVAIDDGVAFRVESEDGLVVLDWFEQRHPNSALRFGDEHQPKQPHQIDDEEESKERKEGKERETSSSDSIFDNESLNAKMSPFDFFPSTTVSSERY